MVKSLLGKPCQTFSNAPPVQNFRMKLLISLRLHRKKRDSNLEEPQYARQHLQSLRPPRMYLLRFGGGEILQPSLLGCGGIRTHQRPLRLSAPAMCQRYGRVRTSAKSVHRRGPSRFALRSSRTLRFKLQFRGAREDSVQSFSAPWTPLSSRQSKPDQRFPPPKTTGGRERPRFWF